MLKLMKYELRKKLIPYLIVFAVTLAVEIFAAYSILTKSDGKIGISVALFTMIGTFGMFYIFILAVDSYSKEISSKYSFMTFMTPNSSYKIIGSKLLTTFVIAVLATLLVAACFILDVNLFLSQYDEVDDLLDMLKDVFGQMGVDLTEIVINFIVMMISVWFTIVCTVCFAYLSITLSFTVLANSKARKIVSILIFLVLFFVTNKIEEFIPYFDYGSTFLLAVAGEWLSYLFEIVVMVICFITSGYLLDKKVSL